MTLRLWVIAVAVCVSALGAGADEPADELPRPGNVTLSWNPNSFSVTAQWSKPTGLDAECKVNYTVVLCLEKCTSIETECNDNRQTPLLNHTWNVSTEKEICVIIRTNPMECGNKKPSKPVNKTISPPLALVKNFSCVYYSLMKMNCTWTLISEARDLQLFYRNESDRMKPCIHNFTNGPMKMGCHLDDIKPSADIKFIISGTDEGSQIPNIFIMNVNDAVKLEPPKVHIKTDGKSLNICSSTPNFSKTCWKSNFTYSICNEEKNRIVEEPQCLLLDYNPECIYKFQAQTILSHYCGVERTVSEMSEPTYFGERTDLNGPFKVAMIVTPILVSCCLIVALVLFRRYKDIILPNIPEPSLLFKDILNSTNDVGQSKSLYVPIMELVERDVRLELSSTSLQSKS